jgi:hypothetical protein
MGAGPLQRHPRSGAGRGPDGFPAAMRLGLRAPRPLFFGDELHIHAKQQAAEQGDLNHPSIRSDDSKRRRRQGGASSPTGAADAGSAEAVRGSDAGDAASASNGEEEVAKLLAGIGVQLSEDLLAVAAAGMSGSGVRRRPPPAPPPPPPLPPNVGEDGSGYDLDSFLEVCVPKCLLT